MQVALRQSFQEEVANAATHALGLILSLAAGAHLVLSAAEGGPWLLAGCLIYAATLVALYAASTMSHLFHDSRLRHTFRRLDQGLIYLLIAGTYTPFALLFLRTGWWWLLSLTIWGLAIGGFYSKVFVAHRVERVSVGLYVLLGWLPVLAAGRVMELAPWGALRWMVLGGVCYTVGTIFLVYDTKVTYFHAVWHKFVIAGSACHFVAIQFYLVPIAE
jgi:hemolysin III